MRAWPFIVGGIVGLAAALYKAPEIRQALSTVGPSWDNLHPEVQRRALAVIADAKAEGMNVGIFEAWRDPATQQRHIESGASFVTDTMSSYHVWGLAVDFVFLTPLGRWTWLDQDANDSNNDDARWWQLGEIIERHGFEWGGRWKKRDMPHAQLPLVRVAALKASYAQPLDYIGTWRAVA